MKKHINKDSNDIYVSIIGGGNVASHLFKALEAKAIVSIVNPRTLDNLPQRNDIAIISVKDSAIEEVAKKIINHADVIAHTSGSVPMSVSSDTANGWGVFYPLQTFTKGVELDYSEIPFFIEANSQSAQNKLVKLAEMISNHVYIAGSEERKLLHIASVFACNFTNCLMGISRDILSKSNIDFKVMLPLLKQTISKLSNLSPTQAQTGPAARRDYPVMENHLEMLSYDRELQEIYRLMSNHIITKSEKNELDKL